MNKLERWIERHIFLSFVRKEFYHILRDKRTVLIALGMPVIQIILFGFAISTEVQNVRVAVYNPSHDVMAEEITRKIDANKYFTVVDELRIPGRIEKLFEKNEVDLVVVFEENFSGELLHTGSSKIQLIVDATDPNTAQTETGYITNILASYQREHSGINGAGLQIIPELKLLYNPQMKSAYNFVPGVMGLILMLICAMMTSISIVREKERGTMEILLVSPVRPLLIILAKVLPYMVLSCVNLITILLLSVYLLGVPVAGSLFWLSLVSLVFILVSLSLGLLISTLVRTQVAAMLASGMVLILPVVLLSGLIFPVESMPSLLQWVSDIIPAKWYIMAVRKLMIQGVGVIYVWKELVILSSMAFLLVTISLKKFKNRLE